MKFVFFHASSPTSLPSTCVFRTWGLFVSIHALLTTLCLLPIMQWDKDIAISPMWRWWWRWWWWWCVGGLFELFVASNMTFQVIFMQNIKLARALKGLTASRTFNTYMALCFSHRVHCLCMVKVSFPYANHSSAEGEVDTFYDSMMVCLGIHFAILFFFLLFPYRNSFCLPPPPGGRQLGKRRVRYAEFNELGRNFYYLWLAADNNNSTWSSTLFQGRRTDRLNEWNGRIGMYLYGRLAGWRLDYGVKMPIKFILIAFSLAIGVCVWIWILGDITGVLFVGFSCWT